MKHTNMFFGIILIIITCFYLCQSYDVSTVSFKTFEGTNYMHHGEGPFWDHDNELLYWVDVLNHNVYRMQFATGEIEMRHFEYGDVNVVTPIADTNQVLVSIKSEAYILDWDSQEADSGLQLLSAVDLGRPANVINEGKPDALGRFWAGTKGRQTGDDVNPDEATLYMITEDNYQNPDIKIRPVTISNGLTWNSNNTIFYYADSPTYQVVAYDFDLKTGQISNSRVVIDIRDWGFTGIPDGMTIDSDDNLWIAIMFNSTIIHVNSETGSVIGAYEMPAKQVTSVMWGGPNLDILFITSSTKNLSETERSEQPFAGSLFTITNTGYKGVPTHKFKFTNKNGLY